MIPGLTVGVMGPAGGVRLPRATADQHVVLLGDVTTLGLFRGLMSGTPGTSYSGAVEVHDDDREAAAALVPELELLPAGRAPGASLIDWVTAGAGAKAPKLDGHVLISGHTQTAQTLRSRYRGRGLPRRSVALKAHWATGRRGL